MQYTSHVLMIRPVKFDYNEETAVNNHFQVRSADNAVQQKAAQEFESLVTRLRDNGIDVTVVNDTPEPHTPDSVFPNNWVSFHEDGSLVLYPMFAANRRLERKQQVIDAVKNKFSVKSMIDLSFHEQDNHFLEGTGSMVLDRDNQIAYACLSPRTDKKVLAEFCHRMNYRPVSFTAVDARAQLIYHTNVMMCVADTYVVICMASITSAEEKQQVAHSIQQTGKQLVEISFDQMDHFAGNMLQLNNAAGEKLLVMSTQAYNSLTPVQAQTLGAFNKIIHADIGTIETNGGGSARCMIAEIFLPVVQEVNRF